MARFLCVCLSATLQKTVTFKKVALESVNRSEKYIIDASGKAINSARVLNQIEPGCVTLICPLGKENAHEFLNLASLDSLEVFSVETPGKTRECITLLDSEKGTTTELVVGEPLLDDDFESEEECLLFLIGQKLAEVDGVLLAGSCPPCWSKGLVPYIARIACEANKIFLADYCGENLLQTLELCVPSIIKINDDEFFSTFCNGEKLSAEQLKLSIIQKSSELQNAFIVTRGQNSTFAAKNGDFFEFPAEIVKAVNTTACGDSFSAGFLYEYANTGDFENSLARGTWCAARNAESPRPGDVLSGKKIH